MLPRPLQLLTRRPTLRFRVDIIVQTEIQRGYNPQGLFPQPVKETMDSLTVSLLVMNLMILGIRILLLMSQSMPTTITTPTT